LGVFHSLLILLFSFLMSLGVRCRSGRGLQIQNPAGVRQFGMAGLTEALSVTYGIGWLRKYSVILVGDLVCC